MASVDEEADGDRGGYAQIHVRTSRRNLDQPVIAALAVSGVRSGQQRLQYALELLARVMHGHLRGVARSVGRQTEPHILVSQEPQRSTSESPCVTHGNEQAIAPVLKEVLDT